MKIELTWAADDKRRAGGRWRKKYRGEIFFYSEIEGKSDREGKRQAIEAFKVWRAQIDLKNEKEKPNQDEYTEAIRMRKDMLEWLAVEQDPDPIRHRLLSELKTIEAEFAKPKPRPISAIGLTCDPIPRAIMNMGEILVWMSRLESLREHHRWLRSQMAGSTLDEHIGEYLAVQLRRAKSGQIKIRTYKTYP